MDNTLEKLYALRAQMSAAELPLDAIDEKIRIEEDKVTSWKQDLDEISSSVRTFIQPIIKKWGASSVELFVKFNEAEISTFLINLDGQDVVLCQDQADKLSLAPQSKNKKEALKVVFPDGFEIFEPRASTTFGKAIEKIGAERVASVSIEGLISKNPDGYKAYQIVGGGYFVNTHSSTVTKGKQLEDISKRLGLDLKISVVPGVYVNRKTQRVPVQARSSKVDVAQLLEELQKKILSISPNMSVDRSLKSYLQFTYNSAYVANVLQRKKCLRVMLNDEYARLKGLPGVVEAPNAHYGHMNRYVEVNNQDGIARVIEYILKMISIPESSVVPNKIRIRLDKTGRL